MKTNRKIATIAATALIALGGLALAPSASAMTPQPLGTWGGTLTCAAPRQVTAHARTTGGRLYMFAAGLAVDMSHPAGLQLALRGPAHSGAWTVSGAASSASGSCT
jgi:hypothetical protein